MSEIGKVLTVLRGIGARDAHLATKFINPENYVQHNHIFRFEDGLTVEHWIFSAKGAPPDESGHTQTDGPTQADPSADTEKNKSIVRQDLYGVEDGKLAERWGFPEEVPPREEWKNNNGLL